MTKVINLSEAALIGLHGLALITRKAPEPVTSRQIAKVTGASENTIAKVMQRLSREGLVHSQRGPAGGFTPGRDPSDISFLMIYEAIEGRADVESCPFSKGTCVFDECILGDFVQKMSKDFLSWLDGRKLSDFI